MSGGAVSGRVASGGSRALAWGALLRVSLSPSAAADVAAGVVVGAGAWPAGLAPFALILASLCVYHGGMALNDWADRAHDARTRPERPIPSGAIGAGQALAAAVVLLVAGPLLALAAGTTPALLLAAVALLAALYDVAGRGPWRGPLLLAACRAGNVGAGLALGLAAASAAEPSALEIGAPLALYAAYVFVLSRLGRMEDAEDDAPVGRRPAMHLGAAALLLLAVPWVPAPTADEPLARAAAVLLAALAAWPLGRLALRDAPWERAAIPPAMGAGLRRLLVVTAALALRADWPAGLLVALAILCGYPLSHALRRRFPPS